MHQCKSISVLSGSSHTFTVHHHIFRQPCDKNCFICSGTHFLCYSLQVQLSDPVIQTVLKNTRAMLLLLQRSLHGDDLKRAHFSQDFQTNCARLCRMCVCLCVCEVVTVFILLKWVYPSALLLRCPWYAAERIVWKLSLSRGEALEGLQMKSSQVGQLGSNKTHTAIFSIWTRFLIRKCTSFLTLKHFVLPYYSYKHTSCSLWLLNGFSPFWYHRHVSNHTNPRKMNHLPSSPFPLLEGWVFHSQS